MRGEKQGKAYKFTRPFKGPYQIVALYKNGADAQHIEKPRLVPYVWPLTEFVDAYVIFWTLTLKIHLHKVIQVLLHLQKNMAVGVAVSVSGEKRCLSWARTPIFKDREM